MPACFNEAAGIHRRKPDEAIARVMGELDASMRPPEFTGGNVCCAGSASARCNRASMRPPEFTGGNTSAPMVSPSATM